MQLDRLSSFPVTAFDADGELALGPYREHLRRQIDAGPAAIFACCGTGEFFSLTLDEYAAAVRTAVAETAGALPVFAGTGYGTAMAKQYAAAAREAGADGLLVLPPYLIKPSQQGLLDHFRALAASTDLPLIAYQRDNAVFTPDSVAELARIPGVKGFKDGVGDLDLLQRMMAVAPDLTYFNGLPTAEVTARSYAAIGVKAYSSAVHCFAPEIAHAYEAGLDELLTEFYLPLVKLRDQGAGYAVSLVKAAVRRRGVDVGSVRSPLTDPLPEHLEELDQLLEQGLTVVRKAAA
ncbi:5-dehydro-4-deoxyglucarate dehydratase [Kribbella sp. ALI-6-A]|uniref:5-dehydro-4-deoxyglucarate dehydratase n=1 Tax=Kribbella sp. ALI-6-A TaxID=1933817 RepID=UPI00097C279F|nr:5-dehydro-4-deoxyglucarate dehydratase [Kribbella sp. ALI-6-A]ONI67025.1 5-dehydro-4-deoxyglucarate dehydratase [Kribbella sp. ALI-6-A]